MTVAVTVDDGFRDFVDGGLPSLQRLGLKATLYVPTGFVGATSRWLSPDGEGSRAMLTWSELSTVAQAGVECGAHSHTHAQMDRLDRKDVAREIALSKTLLEQHLQRPVTSFAYPYGYSGKATRELVRQLGFTHACSVRDLVSNSLDDDFRLPRITVTPELSPSELGAVLDQRRGLKDDLRSSGRAVVSRALRASHLKKRTPQSARWEAPPTNP
jgi:peptidoglycan/xylan/chitin deacetylase (PgdA/CDA1 family)